MGGTGVAKTGKLGGQALPEGIASPAGWRSQPPRWGSRQGGAVASASQPAIPVREAGIAVGGLAVLAFGHMTADFYATFLTPLLPLLAMHFGLSTFLCSLLVAAVGISGSTVQPLFGAIGGRAKGKPAVVLGMVMMAVFFSCLGLATNVLTLFLLLVAGGLGCALFHPHAATMATDVSPGRRGRAMSVFTLAGTAGIFLSPKIVPRIASAWGLGALVVTMPLGLICAAFLLLAPLPSDDATPGGRTEWRGLLSGDVRGLATLVVSAILHTITVTGFCAFLPLMLCGERGFTVTAAGDMLAWFILSGSLGVVIAGYLSDRIGRWRVILLAYVAAVPLLFGFLGARGLPAQGFLMGAGVALWAALPCTITLAQELAPDASGIASGMVMGFSWGVGGIVLPLFGMIADRAGKAYTMHWIALLPVGAMLSLLVLKRVSRNPDM